MVLHMSNFANKSVVDTNVPIIANLANDPASIPDDLIECVLACIEAIEHVMQIGRLVIDAGDEIFDEYRQLLSLKGQPGVGDGFVKWVHDNRWNFPENDRVKITKGDDSYHEFPHHRELNTFDYSDRKFVAVANAHPERPPILQATDSKWWGWKPALDKVNIVVTFLCPTYIEAKYEQKMQP